MTWLSGAFLSSNGWEKNGFVWTKGNDKIIFDGAKFLLNGNKIEHIEQATNIQNDRTNSNSGNT